MYIGKVEIHHKDLFKTPDMYRVRNSGGKPFKTKKEAITAAKRIGRIKLSSKKFPIGSHLAYTTESVSTKKDHSMSWFGDYY